MINQVEDVISYYLTVALTVVTTDPLDKDFTSETSLFDILSCCETFNERTIIRERA